MREARELYKSRVETWEEETPSSFIPYFLDFERRHREILLPS